MLMFYGDPAECATAAALLRTADAAISAAIAAKREVPVPTGTDEKTIDSLLDYINRMKKEKKGDRNDEAD